MKGLRGVPSLSEAPCASLWTSRPRAPAAPKSQVNSAVLRQDGHAVTSSTLMASSIGLVAATSASRLNVVTSLTTARHFISMSRPLRLLLAQAATTYREPASRARRGHPVIWRRLQTPGWGWRANHGCCSRCYVSSRVRDQRPGMGVGMLFSTTSRV